MRVSFGAYQSRPAVPRYGKTSRGTACAASPPTISSPMPFNSMPPTATHWRGPLILSEHLVPVAEPLAVALEPAGEASPRDVACTAARALLDGAPLATVAPPSTWPAWLAPHQVPAAERLSTIIARYGGALLADEVGLGKSYVALAVALARQEPFVLVVPAVLVSQWGDLLTRFGQHAVPIITHESLSVSTVRPSDRPTAAFVVVDEAHRFRNPDTNRYRALARLVVGTSVLLVTATPIHNAVADLLNLLRLFLRDHALAALGLPSLRNAARREADGSLAYAAVGRVIVARSRERVRTGYDGGPVSMVFPRLLDHGGDGARFADDRRTLARLRELLARTPAVDPKSDALEALLSARAMKTIVFTDAQPTARYLLQRLSHRRVAAVFGHVGRFASGDAPRQDVLRAFAPRAQGVLGPAAALQPDVLVATGLLR